MNQTCTKKVVATKASWKIIKNFETNPRPEKLNQEYKRFADLLGEELNESALKKFLATTPRKAIAHELENLGTQLEGKSEEEQKVIKQKWMKTIEKLSDIPVMDQNEFTAVLKGERGDVEIIDARDLLGKRGGP